MDGRMGWKEKGGRKGPKASFKSNGNITAH